MKMMAWSYSLNWNEYKSKDKNIAEHCCISATETASTHQRCNCVLKLYFFQNLAYSEVREWDVSSVAVLNEFGYHKRKLHSTLIGYYEPSCNKNNVENLSTKFVLPRTLASSTGRSYDPMRKFGELRRADNYKIRLIHVTRCAAYLQ